MGVSSWPKGVKSQDGLALPHWSMELLPQTSMTWDVFHVVVFWELFFFWDVCVCFFGFACKNICEVCENKLPMNETLVIKLVRTQEQMLQVDICTFILHIGFPCVCFRILTKSFFFLGGGYVTYISPQVRLDSYFSGDMLFSVRRFVKPFFRAENVNRTVSVQSLRSEPSSN